MVVAPLGNPGSATRKVANRKSGGASLLLLPTPPPQKKYCKTTPVPKKKKKKKLTGAHICIAHLSASAPMQTHPRILDLQFSALFRNKRFSETPN